MDRYSPNEYIIPDFIIKEMIRDDHICFQFCTPSIQPASLDIPLCGFIKEIKRVFIPNGKKIDSQITQMSRDILHEQILYPDHTYVIETDIQFALPYGVSAVSESRSTTGRNDIFVAMIAPRVKGFNYLPSGYIGTVSYIVSPRSYPIKIKECDCLAQMKFIYNTTSNGFHDQHTLSTKENLPSNKIFRVNLKKDRNRVVAYESISQNTIPLTFDAKNDHDVSMYWRPLVVEDTITLHPGPLYILRSIERISLSDSMSMSLISHSRKRGEFHSHYAGFFDPGFGLNEPLPVVFEVRVSMEMEIHHGDAISEGVYERLMFASEHPYQGNYVGQDLRLGKQFIQ